MLTRDELLARQVPRPVGLAILSLVGAAEGLLAPPGVASVLRGVPRSDAVRHHPGLARSPLFGAVIDRSYEDLVTDTLAMQAKGYLAHLPGSRRLGSTDSGRKALAAGRARLGKWLGREIGVSEPA
jgi:hypothetical protein